MRSARRTRLIWWIGAVLFAVALLALSPLALLTGCGPREAAPGQPPAPSARAPRSLAIMDAESWATGSTGRSVGTVMPSGSMLPTYGSNSVLLLETVAPGDYGPGDILVFDDLHGGFTCHRCKATNVAGDAITGGDGNYGAQPNDGWVAAKRIKWRVAGILYTQRGAP